ncbi:MAG: hypothetical protein WCK93_05385 [Nitrosomonadales bacterium]
MKQIPIYGDERTLEFCAFCGGKTGTRDHCPSRVFLDKPYPKCLPVVFACLECNAGFSEDEEYFACLVSCVIAGSTDPEAMPREKTNRILKSKPALRARIEQSRSVIDGITLFNPEHGRVKAVFTKLAQGHALYELHESCTKSPDSIVYLPLLNMSEEQRHAFENPELQEVWPEVGSRAMQRAIIGTDVTLGGWLNVQVGRYRYHASQGDGIDIRIVIHEYLACQVHWA